MKFIQLERGSLESVTHCKLYAPEKDREMDVEESEAQENDERDYVHDLK